MAAGRRLAGEEQRRAARRRRPDVDDVAMEAAIESFRSAWPWFDRAWQESAGRVGGMEIPAEPFQAFVRTYLEKTGSGELD